ncbi:hypothetical protein B484DRAFT_453548 [Ochromonadaceae sp. CCMP2298]|nr:hypothetical protein B484DRAFT_453548 [Ochromonadaceae sp. CCMP2298]
MQLFFLCCIAVLPFASAFSSQGWSPVNRRIVAVKRLDRVLRCAAETDVVEGVEVVEEVEVKEDEVKKYGFEVGMFKALTDKEKKVSPKDLLAKYGGAYLVTSITFAIISYTICYALVSSGVDVASLLEKVGIQSTGAASNAGTAAIAYAVHKAASPIRFPPTVALTPVVANWLGRKAEGADAEEAPEE